MYYAHTHARNVLCVLMKCITFVYEFINNRLTLHIHKYVCIYSCDHILLFLLSLLRKLHCGPLSALCILVLSYFRLQCSYNCLCSVPVAACGLCLLELWRAGRAYSETKLSFAYI